jgi:hypothetical protein
VDGPNRQILGCDKLWSQRTKRVMPFPGTGINDKLAGKAKKDLVVRRLFRTARVLLCDIPYRRRQ